VKKSDFTLGVERARVESVSKSAVVLLLPGKKVEKNQVGKLLEGGGFRFMHLSNVATKKHPGRPWTLHPPKGKQKSYLFAGPEGKKLDSTNDTESLIVSNAIAEGGKPILDDLDLEPTAMYQQTKQGNWALLIRFNKSGAKKLEDFSAANRGEYLAMFKRDKLINAAEIVDPIKGGEVFLTGFGTEDAVNELVTDINGADLPGRLRIESVEYY